MILWNMSHLRNVLYFLFLKNYIRLNIHYISYQRILSLKNSIINLQMWPLSGVSFDLSDWFDWILFVFLVPNLFFILSLWLVNWTIQRMQLNNFWNFEPCLKHNRINLLYRFHFSSEISVLNFSTRFAFFYTILN